MKEFCIWMMIGALVSIVEYIIFKNKNWYQYVMLMYQKKFCDSRMMVGDMLTIIIFTITTAIALVCWPIAICIDIKKTIAKES